MYPWCIVNLSNSTFYIKITTSFVISELFGFYSSLFGAIVVDLHCLIRRAILIFHEQWEDFACLCVSWFYALVSWYDYVPLKFSYRTCLIRKKTFFLSTWRVLRSRLYVSVCIWIWIWSIYDMHIYL